MIETTLNRLFGAVSTVLPQELRDDTRSNVRAAMADALSRMDIVTREEFDIQRAVLQRTREKLEALEARVSAMETQDRR